MFTFSLPQIKLPVKLSSDERRAADLIAEWNRAEEASDWARRQALAADLGVRLSPLPETIPVKLNDPVSLYRDLFEEGYRVRYLAGSYFEVRSPDAKFYIIYAGEQTCSCPSFQCKQFLTRDGKQTCKHLVNFCQLSCRMSFRYELEAFSPHVTDGEKRCYAAQSDACFEIGQFGYLTYTERALPIGFNPNYMIFPSEDAFRWDRLLTP